MGKKSSMVGSTGGCDWTWQCEHGCVTTVTDSMLSEDKMHVNKSCYSGSDPQTRVFCAKGHPMTATSVLVNGDDEIMSLCCGRLSLPRYRILPYKIIPCHNHDQVDLTAGSSREPNVGWKCPWCFLANAYGEPICSLETASTYHSRWKQTANLSRLQVKSANPSPWKPMGCPTGRRHCRICGSKDKATKRFLAGGKKGNPAAALRAELEEMDGWEDESEFEDEDMASAAGEFPVVGPLDK